MIHQVIVSVTHTCSQCISNLSKSLVHAVRFNCHVVWMYM